MSQPPESRRGRPDGHDADEAVLQAAADLLGETGFARLTMDQVAARAGVGERSLSLRWPNKVALVAEALHRLTGVVPTVPDTGNVRDDMLGFLCGLLRMRRLGRRAITSVRGELDSNRDLRLAMRSRLAATFSASVRTIVQRGVDRGELPATTDVDLLATLPLTVLQTWEADHGERPDDTVVKRIVDQFFTP